MSRISWPPREAKCVHCGRTREMRFLRRCYAGGRDHQYECARQSKACPQPKRFVATRSLKVAARRADELGKPNQEA